MYRSKYLDKLKTKAAAPETTRRSFLTGFVAAPVVAPILAKQFVDVPTELVDYGDMVYVSTTSSYSSMGSYSGDWTACTAGSIPSDVPWKIE